MLGLHSAEQGFGARLLLLLHTRAFMHQLTLECGNDDRGARPAVPWAQQLDIMSHKQAMGPVGLYLNLFKHAYDHIATCQLGESVARGMTATLSTSLWIPQNAKTHPHIKRLYGSYHTCHRLVTSALFACRSAVDLLVRSSVSNAFLLRLWLFTTTCRPCMTLACLSRPCIDCERLSPGAKPTLVTLSAAFECSFCSCCRRGCKSVASADGCWIPALGTI